MQARPIISCRGLAKDYALGGGIVHALRDVTLEVQRGEFVAVMGPSGSGKSTLMNMVGCLDTPSAGSIEIDGEDVSHLSADRLSEIRSRRIGFVFQQFNLLRRTSALANVIMPLMYAPVPVADRSDRARRCLELVGLASRMDHQPSQLSGGQQQRVAIARALVNDPAILLADEPTGALDTRTGMEVLELFQRLNRQGITLMVVTHDPEVAAAAGRVLTFRDGRIVSDRRNERPRDLAAELAALPPAEEEDAAP
ncbi:ABC transporter ATP-binding protein [Rhodocista pekingensis]|uniref:ABC transporter ATP-binding protein n=1 Tax=Rhodocista pekingensis TaxID=201185 RepID=A0ABW2KYM1_9PROT